MCCKKRTCFVNMVDWCVWLVCCVFQLVCDYSYWGSWSQDTKEVEANQKPMAADRALRFAAAFRHLKHVLKRRDDWRRPAMIEIYHNNVENGPHLVYVYFYTFWVHVYVFHLWFSLVITC